MSKRPHPELDMREFTVKTMSLLLLVSLTIMLGVQRPESAQSAMPAVDHDVTFTDARMLRFPDVSSTQICFIYAGDIWVVAKSGGNAHRLSTAPGEEYKPRFSPDGKRIAFSGNYDGNVDLYVVPSDGGIVERVTHHPASDMMIDWSPDGKSLLYSTGATSPTGRYSELYTVSAEGGLPNKLPVPWGDNGSLSPDGMRIAYTPWSRDFRTWKRYRGGMASRLWIFDLKTFDATEISKGTGNFSNPMWYGDKIYYLGDDCEDCRSNICVYDVKTGKSEQITQFTDFDVRFPSIGDGEIVFEHGGGLKLLDLKTNKVREIKVNVVTDGATLRPKVADVSHDVSNSTISPSGERAAFEARGEIFTVPAEHGVTRNITLSSGVAERYPAWSPDGKTIAYFSDRSGEYELTIRPAEGGTEQKLTSVGAGFKYEPQWSPDSRKIVFVDKAMRMYWHDLENGQTTQFDKGLWMYHGDLEGFRVSWSADSRWFAYSRGQENQNGAIYIYDTTTKATNQVTAGYYNDYNPVFDPAGNYLYFISGRSFNPIYSDIDESWIYTNTAQVLAVPLRGDVKSPLATRNDDEGSSKEEKKPDEPKKGETAKSRPVEIELKDFERRAVELPIEAGRFSQLQAVEGKLLYLRRQRNGSADRNSQIVSYSLEDRDEKTLEENASGFEISANGKKMLVNSRGSWSIRSIGGGGSFGGSRGRSMPEDDSGKKDKLGLSLADMQVTVDPAAEWRQIFDDAWRIERDYFYDPGMHGVNWAAIHDQYGALLDQCVTRWDVNFLLGEMIGEINSSHTYRWGGDSESSRSLSVGLLGCDYSLENGRYRFSHIYDGAPWDSEVRSPLNESGLNISEGTYLLAVNGLEVDVSMDPWAAFQGLGGKTVALTINSEPKLESARTVYVTAMNNEGRLRYLSAIEETRASVDKASDGQVGYVYVPNTGRNGQNELVRQLRAQFKKKAMIVDERWNGGGQLPDRFVELMNRPILNYWGVRDGHDWQTPMFAHNGPKAMLINGRAGSGGDAFPYYFKTEGCGKLIGTRTWGGLIGYTGVPELIDGGTVIAPTFGIYNTNGEWIIEGYGVDPDIEVIAHPTKVAKGGDPEVERAIEELVAELKSSPPVVPKKPAYPNRSGK
ncbi:MAG: PD40 domain-containing protein [Planctomycetes bacterium]|nr:PD40 domain-containing protein [Planctomycetota bacterium]